MLRKLIAAAALSIPLAANAGILKTYNCHVEHDGDTMPLTFILSVGDDGPNDLQAWMEGNNNVRVEVGVVYTGSQLTFFEVTDTGNTTHTSIFIDNTIVHSRHMEIMGKHLFSQYVGKCRGYRH